MARAIEGVQAVAERLELGDLDGIGLEAGLDPLQGGLGAVVEPPHP